MRVLIYLAVVVLFAGIVYGSIQTGRLLERAANRRRAAFIDEATYHQMGNLLRSIFFPKNIDDIVVIPDSMREEAKEIFAKIGRPRRGIR